MFSLQSHNQVLYHLTQLTNSFRPKSSSLAVVHHRNDSKCSSQEIICHDSFTESIKNCHGLPVELLNHNNFPSPLRLGSNDKLLNLEESLQIKITKRSKKQNKWNVSFISGASFTENKREGFLLQNVDTMTILSVKPLHGFLNRHQNLSISGTQIRGFKSQRMIKSELERNPSLLSRLTKLFMISEQQNDPASRINNLQTLKSVSLKNEKIADDRVKLAFAEGYLEGRSRHKPNKIISWIKNLQSIITFVFILSLGGFVISRLRSGEGKIFKFPFGENLEIDPETVHVTFDDIKGIDEAKLELESVVEYLKNPGKFTSLGGKLPKGVLISGPPGTGKTLLARAVAGEAGVPFFHAAGSEFDEILVGQGAKRIRDLFRTAKERAPCVIFIDEIDSVGSRRSNSIIHPYANQTINQLLSEMDGFHQNEGIIVLGATNRASLLDPALLRPGRFDVQISVRVPDFIGRKEILKLYLQKIIHQDFDLDELAKSTRGFTGADIFNMINQAALRAALTGADRVNMQHIDYAKQKMFIGPERKRDVDEELNKIVAYHETGHAIVAYYTKHSNNLYKATILPAGQSLGHTMFTPKRDLDSYTKNELLADMDVNMGGRAAEELIFGTDKVSLGAFSDFKKANDIAENMVMKYGMSEKYGFRVRSEEESKPDKLVDCEVRRILQESYERAKTILKNHPREMKLVADALLKYETLDGEDIENLLNGKKMKVESGSIPQRKVIDVQEEIVTDIPKNVL